MGYGPGGVEQKIEAILSVNPGVAFTISELCELVYPTHKITKSRRVIVLRAVARLAKKLAVWQHHAYTAGPGKTGGGVNVALLEAVPSYRERRAAA